MLFFRALISFLLLPGLAGVIIPPLVGLFDPWKCSQMELVVGIVTMSIGAVILLFCVYDFYRIGKGTLAPWDPPQHLVVVGLYRFVRNPMYIGVLILVIGWAILFLSPLLFLYAIGLAIGFHVRTVKYEEPHLLEAFSSDWERYAQQVRRWMPRLKPYKKHD